MKKAPIDRVARPVRKLFSKDIALGITLLITALIAMAWANSPWATSYHHLWETKLTIGFEGFKITESLHHWINDGLMAYFFLLVGLEIKREFISGELSTLRKASLPIAAAIGGMLLPALIYLGINWGGPGMKGWGIPMATDIAFAVGLIALAGKAVTSSGKTFLTAMATVDDIGAILIIALFLSSGINTDSLLAGGIYFGIMVIGNLLGIRNFWFYLIVGTLGLWVALLLSGIHATLAGVLAAFTIPARTKLSEIDFKTRLEEQKLRFEQSNFTDDPLLTSKQVEIINEIIKDGKRALTPLQRVEENIKPFVNYGVLPLFALANAGVSLQGNFLDMLLNPIALGVIAGLLLGKLGGVLLATRLTVKLGAGQLPSGTRWKEITGISLMAGIGFTMSIFIAELALEDPLQLQTAKLGIITGSVLSTLFGLGVLRFYRKS
ncbi:Na+/H+ antiporter NhaA [Robiginitalea sp. IMCC43444]|uniref:Na+/H+ antiporter NhaA n=1 Tax=Robiginitalea sp. IMCC43444 TaxID=3459121 RepID=UPI004041498F